MSAHSLAIIANFGVKATKSLKVISQINQIVVKRMASKSCFKLCYSD
ncbi:hypothetical protein HMPREF0530_2794 [Lacticaseibacillus paracasei subsp. paracasei ATCC 25302 = DSM 5622 = JCM 8130]|nr:hypothetical protein HMPREF0530_2794 [Lacticaseibacillus paracasei subsp. paracasei ATCC 25302 = DSM 5622 = JCM 8130]EPC30600.1 hypothetical protein Lpp120_2205 [Lacticaseibacillus paracasei subsp. paracasei Lpp120]